MNKNKGFTLIELLVVIAIIGILASVVLASLSSARNKGKDAAVKSQLASMKAQAELYYSTAESYSGICTALQSANGFGGSGGPGLLKAASDASGITNSINVLLTDAGTYQNTTCHDAADTWVVEAPLSTSASGSPVMYCSDSTGVSKDTVTNIAATTGLTC
jgi:prepilin-type N-terminal cleavage/methylation domain-containing protein